MSTSYIARSYPKPVAIRRIVKAAGGTIELYRGADGNEGHFVVRWAGGYLHLDDYNPKRGTCLGFERYGGNDPSILEDSDLFVSEHDEQYVKLMEWDDEDEADDE